MASGNLFTDSGLVGLVELEGEFKFPLVTGSHRSEAGSLKAGHFTVDQAIELAILQPPL